MPSPSAARHLAVVDTETGERLDGCPHCEELQGQLEMAESDRKKWAKKYRDAVRDLDAEAREHPLFEDGRRWHALWRDRCRHPRVEYGPEEFWLVLPFLKHKTMSHFIGRAIEGAAFDPYVYTQRNGRTKRCDEWDRIFKNKASFKRFCERAPRERAA